MRHFFAIILLRLARRITLFAHRVDDDLTGKFIYLPAIPEYEVPVKRVHVLRRDNQPGSWIIRYCDSGTITNCSYAYLKKGKVDAI